MTNEIGKHTENTLPINIEDEHKKLIDDREFWLSCVRHAIEKCMTSNEAEEIIGFADKILAAKQERFPS